MSSTSMEAGWQPIETAPIAKSDEDDIWIWACRRGHKLPMLTTYDHENGCWYTFNLALERGMGRQNPNWRWEPTHWMPVQEVPQ
jgi:hypothetical protein